MMFHFIALILAVGLDSIIGDPAHWPHPVKGFGIIIGKIDKSWNKGQHRKLKGCLFVFMIVLIVFVFSCVAIFFLYKIYPVIGIVAEALLIATTIAQKDLAEAARRVQKPLNQSDIPLARQQLSQIVGRDTKHLEESDIVRGTVETVAENTTDGITAPLFWAFIGGAPLALTYRLINTCDSMIGYKNDAYKDFGWGAARLDDVVNWLPARLTGIAMMLSYHPRHSSYKGAWQMMLRDTKKHPSPNSGWGEATMAVLLGIQLGGTNYYDGAVSHRTKMGYPYNEMKSIHISLSIKIMRRTVAVFLLMLALGGVIYEITIPWF